MQLTILVPTISRNAGGLFESVRHLHQTIGRTCPTVIMSLKDEYTETDLHAWDPLTVKTFPHLGPLSVGFSPKMGDAIRGLNADLLHVHGIWYGTSIASSSFRRNTGKPNIVSPRGMLDPWALTNSRWKKRIAAVLFEDQHLHGATCIHALCQSESDSIRAYGLKNPIAIIPNGVGLPERQGGSRKSEIGDRKSQAADAGVFREENQSQGTRYPLPATRNAPLRLLFLGRLHPKKGLVQALKAWHSTLDARRSTPPWQFVIAGWDQGGHEAELKRLATELGISWTDIRDIEPKVPISAFSSQLSGFSLLFTGPAFGEEKAALLRSADAFILPSLSEGLPMSVLEAWAYGLPVLMTPECNLPDGFAADAAVRIGAEDAKKAESGKLKAESCGNIEGGLHALFEMSDADRVAMGERGRSLVENRFTWPKIAAQMKEVYEWVLGGGHPPDCVQKGRA